MLYQERANEANEEIYQALGEGGWDNPSEGLVVALKSVLGVDDPKVIESVLKGAVREPSCMVVEAHRLQIAAMTSLNSSDPLVQVLRR